MNFGFKYVFVQNLTLPFTNCGTHHKFESQEFHLCNDDGVDDDDDKWVFAS